MERLVQHGKNRETSSQDVCRHLVVEGVYDTQQGLYTCGPAVGTKGTLDSSYLQVYLWPEREESQICENKTLSHSEEML